MAKKVMYSRILQDFARPLLNEADTDEIFIKKIKVAEVIWNYCIAEEFKLSMFDELNKIVTRQYQQHFATKLVFDQFVAFKKTHFSQYKHFIHKVEQRLNDKGIRTLYVESVHPLDLKKYTEHG